jgi:hypothetical protein
MLFPLTDDIADPLTDVLVEERITFLYRDRDKTKRVSGIYGGLQITERGALRLLVHRRWGDYSYDVRAISHVKKGKAATPFADATRIGAPTAKAVERAERYEASPVQQDVYECWHCGKLFTPGNPGGTPVCRCRAMLPRPKHADN